MARSYSTDLDSLFSFWGLKGVLYAALAMPLLVWSGFLFPFITTKIIYFRLLVEIAFGIYLILALQYPEIRPRWNWLTRTVLVYLGVIFVASIFGVDFSHSFWGTVERGEGVVTILHFVLYFMILSNVLRTDKEWYRYLFTAAMMIAFTALYGFAQLQCYGFNPLAGDSICSLLLPSQGTRISATIGNAAFFAAFVLFGAFLSLYLTRGASNRFLKVFLWVVVVFEFYIVFETRTRGAVLAAAAGLVIFCLIALFKTKKFKIKALSFGLMGLLLAVGLAIYFNRDAGWIKKSNTLERLASISPSDVTTQSRFDTWGASWRALQDRPILGYGYENYNVGFNKYFPARIFKDQGSQIWFDRAHNIVLDVAVASGFIGLAVYLGIFVAGLWVLVRLFRRSDVDWMEPTTLAILLMVYFFQNLFVFDTQATYLMFFLVLALVVHLHKKYLAGAATPGASYYPGYIAPAIVATLVFAAAYFVNIEPAVANRAVTSGILASKLRDYRAIEPAFKRALSYGTYMDAEFRQRLVDMTLDAVSSAPPDKFSDEEKNEMFQFTVAELEKTLKETPSDAKHHLYLMSMLNRLPNNPEAVDRVISLGQEMIPLSATRPQLYFELGQAHFNKGEYDLGLEQFVEAVELSPTTKESHFNYLLAAIIAGRENIVVEQQKILEELGYELREAEYESIARAYFQAGNKQKVAEYYELTVAADPGNAGYRAKLAVAYKDICQVEKARLSVDEAVRLDSSFVVEAQEFLRQLEEACGK